MHYLVVGTGAIGTYLGVNLAHVGHRVTFLARPATAARLRQSGIQLTCAHGEVRRIPAPEIAASPAEALENNTYDGVLLAIKTYHTPAFLESVQPWRESFPPVVCMQNGVEAESVLASFFGESKVLAGTVTTAVNRPTVGEAIVERARGIGLAEGHPLTPLLAEAWRQAGVEVRTYANGAAMKWSKLLTNLLGNATSAILDMPPGDVFAHPASAHLEITQLREALAVMRALRLPVVDLPGAAVRQLAWALRWLPFVVLQPGLQRVAGSGRGGKMPSLHIDLHSGRGQTEVDALNGAVVRYGEKTGVPTPVNRGLARILEALTAGTLPLDTFRGKPEALYKAILPPKTIA